MSRLILKVALLDDFQNVTFMDIIVNEHNFERVRKKIESELLKIKKVLNQYKKDGLIKSISRPKNKKIAEKLKQINHAREDLKEARRKIIQIFYK